MLQPTNYTCSICSKSFEKRELNASISEPTNRSSKYEIQDHRKSAISLTVERQSPVAGHERRLVWSAPGLKLIVMGFTPAAHDARPRTSLAGMKGHGRQLPQSLHPALLPLKLYGQS